MKLRKFGLGALAFMLVLPSQAAIIQYWTVLNGANEVPSNASTATGTATAILDDVALELFVNVSFSGLSSAATAAHIHCCVGAGVNAGVAVGLTAFPGVTSGNYSRLFDLTDSTIYNATFVANNGGTTASARAALLAALGAGNTYVNIHNATFPGGEIRGQLGPVPEPGTSVLLTLGLGLMAVRFRKRRS
jgi:hypothetical protein